MPDQVETEKTTPKRRRARPHRGADPSKVVFVGGTGRSGTHIVARLVARTRSYALIPVEVRFHVERRGFPGLLAGEVTKKQFIKRLRGFWWKGFQTNRFRGLYRLMDRERFDAAVERFDKAFDDDPEQACRDLFFDLLWHRAELKESQGIVEQSCDVIAAAPTLVRLFPEARFIHVVRDGRDASASRVRQTRGLIYPRTRRQGLEWWENRIRAIDKGARAIPQERLLEMPLDDLLLRHRQRALRNLLRFSGVFPGRLPKRFLRRHMNTDAANFERWRRGLSEDKQAEIERDYVETLRRLDADGIRCASLLQANYERVKSGEGRVLGPEGRAERDARQKREALAQKQGSGDE
jgi:hypothetical protein